jgi:hypothetical protein
MFKLPDLPSPQAECHELADFAELLAWDKGKTSAREITAYLGRLGENDHNIGCDDNDDENSDEMDEVMNELERPATACGTGYPFELELAGTALRHAPNHKDHRTHLYQYLLLSTRLNMTKDRVHAKIDGADLLEEIAAETLRCYLGPKRARSFVFGTAAPGTVGFEDKINQLCRVLGEGGTFKNRDIGSVVAKDDKLDTVTWLPFSDNSCNQLIVFGQCKTGSSWDGMITQLRPDAFIKRWMSETYIHDPLRAFCVAEAVNRARWVGHGLYAGLLFDRCRIVDFCEKPDSKLLGKIIKWTTAAKATVCIKPRRKR